MREQPIGIVASGAMRGTMTFFAAERIRADYVCVETERGKRSIYEIFRETAQNSRLTDFEAVRFIEPGDDYTKYNVYIGEATAIACLDERGQVYHDMYEVAAPGARVYRASAEDLSRVYDVVPGSGRQKIGTLLRQESVDVYLDFDKLLRSQVHLAVVGRTGSGKSWLVRHMLERLKMRCVVFSPTDEYDALLTRPVVRRKTDVALELNPDTAKQLFDLKPSEYKAFESFYKNGMEDIAYASDELSKAMAQYFRDAAAAKAQSTQLSLLFGIDESAATLSQYEASLCRKIENVEFSAVKLDSNWEEGPERTIVYNLQGCRRSEEEKIIYNTLYPIFESRRERFRSDGSELPTEEHIAIVVEEAQDYVPSNRSTLCKELLVNIARTGRKYGLHVLFLSQRPRYIDQTLLSQCGGGLFFNLPNPDDVDYVMSAASLNRAATMKSMIQNFNTGECTLLQAERSAADLVCRISAFDE